MKKMKFILSGGGTGGHIYPAIAIANELKTQFPEADILFVGASGKMEMQKVPQAGFTIKGLWIAGLQRKLTFSNLLFPVKLITSLIKSFFILLKFKPNAVIGTGGFASGAVLKMANIMGIPTVIQEQNSYPGITNKLLAKKAAAICVAYEGLETFFPKSKIAFTGNPVRSDLFEVNQKREEALMHYNLDGQKNSLLVLGGSLGARKINQLIEANLPLFEKENLQIIWQCGKLYYHDYKKHQSQNVLVLDFIERMDLAYAAANFIVSRAGASSVSELALVAKPTIFIPSPNVAEDHQTKNAKSIVSQGAALLVTEKDSDTEFPIVLEALLKDIGKQQSLEENFIKLAKPNATKDIVSIIKDVIKK
jgi:UDP-N-acetylglucosamine--N-acetylmuramyl-(pentapeptide) pyrophosphoryl-undecaprenol N-acetylglucosamine transferase